MESVISLIRFTYFFFCSFCNSILDDKLSEEEKNKIAELKLPSGFYNNVTECNGCRGCNVDDFIFENYKDSNSDINDDSPLPLKQTNHKFSKSTTSKPTLTSFAQSSKTNEASRNIFGSYNSSTSDQGFFNQSSFTPKAKDNTPVFGNNNIFGGNNSIFSKPKEEPKEEAKVATTAEEVKKNFSFTNSLKPSVFGQNIFGQATSTPATLTATFGSNQIKTGNDSSAAKTFSFGEMLQKTATSSLATTTPATNTFSFGRFFFCFS